MLVFLVFVFVAPALFAFPFAFIEAAFLFAMLEFIELEFIMFVLPIADEFVFIEFVLLIVPPVVPAVLLVLVLVAFVFAVFVVLVFSAVQPAQRPATAIKARRAKVRRIEFPPVPLSWVRFGYEAIAGFCAKSNRCASPQQLSVNGFKPQASLSCAIFVNVF